jgi:hypothetical protein
MNIVEVVFNLIQLYDRNKNESNFFDNQIGPYRAYVTHYKVGIHNLETCREIITIYDCSRSSPKAPNSRIRLDETYYPKLTVYGKLGEMVDITHLVDVGSYFDEMPIETRKMDSFDEEYVFQMNTIYNFGTQEMYDAIAKYCPSLAKICYMSNTMIDIGMEENFDNLDIPEGLI